MWYTAIHHARRSPNWPAWPEFTASKGEADPTGEFIQYKKDIVAIYGEKTIRESWLKVCKELEAVTGEIGDKGTSAILEVQYEDLFGLNPRRNKN